MAARCLHQPTPNWSIKDDSCGWAATMATLSWTTLLLGNPGKTASDTRVRSHSCRWWVLVLIFSAGSAMGANEDAIHGDLLTTITLEGHDCGEITDVEHHAVADYTVSCSNGSRFHVWAKPHGTVHVQDLATGEESDARRALPHSQVVAHMLTAAVHLADVGCGVVVGVVAVSPKEHLVTCSKGKRYRVHLNDAGETTVDEQ